MVAITTKLFQQKARGALAVPTIIKVSPEKYDEVKETLETTAITVKEIRLFNMMAFIMPTQYIQALAKLEGVEKIYYDTSIWTPEFPLTYIEPFGVDMLMPTVIKERIRSRIERLMARRPAEIRKEWVPTSEGRAYIGAEIADKFGITGKGVKVAVLDTGIFLPHSQISWKVEDVDVTKETVDSSGHGSHCITTVLGDKYTPYTGLTCLGVAPKANGLSVKVLSSPIGCGSTSNVLKGMEVAYNWGAEIISMSLGSEKCQADEPNCVGCPSCEAVKMLVDAGVLVVVANGNAGDTPSTTGCPACSESALSVGAWDSRKNEIAKFSSRGPTYDKRIKPDICAPGVNVYSGTWPGSLCDVLPDKVSDSWANLSGTSMATPHVSGLLALAVELFRVHGYDLTIKNVKDIFTKYGKEKTNDTGWGVINFDWFVKALEVK